MSPLCESFLTAAQLDAPEIFYPLHARVCADCYLVQLREYVAPDEIFSDYAYFSSYSSSWVEHARRYCHDITARLALGGQSQVVELASNDGYLLQHFRPMGIPVLGVEPAANVAEAALAKGVPTEIAFFGRQEAQRLVAMGKAADLVIGNNVLAQVPDLDDFVGGIQVLLKPTGTVTLEFPHLLKLMDGNQFDTIYHEHFYYFSLATVERLAAKHSLAVYEVEELPTHGGSLRVYLCHTTNKASLRSSAVYDLLRREQQRGLQDSATYAAFTEQVQSTKRALLRFLVDAREAGKRVVGYGAPGKGNTLLNYCGIRTDLIEFLVDKNPYKHGRFAPGTHIPIYPVEDLDRAKPDYIVIMPWNLRDEILQQLQYAKQWHAQFVLAIPKLEVISSVDLAA